MTPLAIAGASLRRFARDRSALFFTVVLPIVIIVIVGSSFGSEGRFEVGLVVDPSSVEGTRIAESLRSAPGLDVVDFDTVDEGRTALRRGEVSTVAVVPTDTDDAVAAGDPIVVRVLAQQESEGQRGAATAVSGVLADHATVVTAARAIVADTDGSFPDTYEAVAAVADAQPPAEVTRTVVDTESGFLPAGFSYSAPTMLVLFIFVTAVTSSSSIVENRRLGIHDRVLAGPVTPGALVLGEACWVLMIAVLQATLIVVVGAVAFGVDWGDPLAAAGLVVVWALVGTGAGVLAGTLFRTSEQASSIGSAVAIVAGMLGGCMWPLEIVPDTLRTIGHAVPHAWAVDGWIELLSHGAGIGDIATELAVLAGFAAVLLVAATIRLRSLLTS